MHHLSKILPATLILLLAAWLAPQPASAQDAKPVGVRLQQIVLPEVVFEGLPLPELAKMLTADSKKHDPNKQGVQIEAGHRLPGARRQGCVHGCRCEGRAGSAEEEVRP